MKQLLMRRLLALCVLLAMTAVSFPGYLQSGVAASDSAENAYMKSVLNLKHTLRFNQNGKFKIVIFADIQDTYPLQQSTLTYMNRILAQEKPDLVLLGGDNHSGNIATESLMQTYLTAMSEPMESRKIPWAQIYGNHVTGGYGFTMGGPDKQRQQEMFEAFSYNISKAGNVYGLGNYVLPILRSDSDKIAFNVFCLDSHDYLNNYKPDFEKKVVLDRPIYGGASYGSTYETIHFDQIKWYWDTSVALEKYNGSKIAAMMIFHIALNEWEYVSKNPQDTNMTGRNMEGTWPSELNSGLFQACYERGDVKGMFCGHCHKNDFCGEYMGITLGFVPTIGCLAYFSDENRGARVIEIDQDDAFNFTTRMVYCKDLKG